MSQSSCLWSALRILHPVRYDTNCKDFGTANIHSFNGIHSNIQPLWPCPLVGLPLREVVGQEGSKLLEGTYFSALRCRMLASKVKFLRCLVSPMHTQWTVSHATLHCPVLLCFQCFCHQQCTIACSNAWKYSYVEGATSEIHMASNLTASFVQDTCT